MGKLYWADVVSDRLRRANLDGTSIEDIAVYSDPFANPSGITVDEEAGKIYWRPHRQRTGVDLPRNRKVEV